MKANFLRTLALILPLAASFTSLIAREGPPIVDYFPKETIVEGDQPLSTSFVLSITAPNNIGVGQTVSITPTLTILTKPEGVPDNVAFSYVTFTPATLQFTAPGQVLTTVVQAEFPLGIEAGAYAYKIMTPGWATGTQDGGAFINATVFPQRVGDVPTVDITTPLQDAVFTYEPLVGPLNVPIQFTSAAPTISPITAIDADINGIALPVTSVNNGDGSYTSTGTATITSPGIYTVRARATNDLGTGNDAVDFRVVVSAPAPTVAIAQPLNGSSFTMIAGTTLTVPYSFSGYSNYGGVTSLVATLNGQSVTFAPAGLGTATATGTGNFALTTGGTYELVVTATDIIGSATARSRFTVLANTPPPPTVAISQPTSGATFTIPVGAASVNVPFSYTGTAGTGSLITSLTGTLNGSAITVGVTGIGSPSATSSGSLSISTPGSYTLAATASTAVGTASTSTTFTVVRAQPPAPGCGVNWLPPISLGKTQKGGQTVAIKFELDCGCEKGIDRTGDGDPDHYPGQRTKSKTKIDKTVVIAISEIFANGTSSQPQLFIYGQYTIQGNDMYHLNFVPARGTHRYRIEIFSSANGVPQVLATREFTTR
ncbi:MAG: hypothetical protein NDI75_15500 [Candidatus Didemnitutus sp.]|nr:hypothetical protein [Candidatus Didemnitutus sp.]